MSLLFTVVSIVLFNYRGNTFSSNTVDDAIQLDNAVQRSQRSPGQSVSVMGDVVMGL